jgi:membrane-associated protease RseP (regulator of RpoE activity)
MRKKPYLHILLFILTLFSTITVGAIHQGVNPFIEPLNIYKGIPFSIALLIILLSHEFSHYLASRRHGVEATLPYFIPAPTLFGTFGAFIKMKSPITTRNALMDIGSSGPIAGFFVSILVTIIGLPLSKIVPVNNISEVIKLGDSLLFSFLTKLILGSVPSNHEIFLHPVAFAGWIGFFVTSMNLLPVGQLDGGHILYSLLGERHKLISISLIIFMIILGIFVWEGWIVWSILLVILGFKHPPIIYSEVPLASNRKIIGWSTLIIFILTFTPVPVMNL